MNETLRIIKERRSCKRFKPDMIPEEDLKKIIEAGTWAPSGKGLQSAIILAVTNKEVINKLKEENRKAMGVGEEYDPFYGAPVVLVVLAKKDVFTHVYDGSLVIGNMLIAAESLGIGGVWIHRAKEEFESEYGKDLLKSLGIEEEYEGIGHCCLGYQEGEKMAPRDRKENYVYYIK